MSKTNNLGDFLTDLANTIRTAKGTTGPIAAQNFSTEIQTISTPGELADNITTSSADNAVPLIATAGNFNRTKITGIDISSAEEMTKVDNDGTINELTSANGTGIIKAITGDLKVNFIGNVPGETVKEGRLFINMASPSSSNNAVYFGGSTPESCVFKYWLATSAMGHHINVSSGSSMGMSNAGTLGRSDAPFCQNTGNMYIAHLSTGQGNVYVRGTNDSGMTFHQVVANGVYTGSTAGEAVWTNITDGDATNGLQLVSTAGTTPIKYVASINIPSSKKLPGLQNLGGSLGTEGSSGIVSGTGTRGKGYWAAAPGESSSRAKLFIAGQTNYAQATTGTTRPGWSTVSAGNIINTAGYIDNSGTEPNNNIELNNNTDTQEQVNANYYYHPGGYIESIENQAYARIGSIKNKAWTGGSPGYGITYSDLTGTIASVINNGTINSISNAQANSGLTATIDSISNSDKITTITNAAAGTITTTTNSGTFTTFNNNGAITTLNHNSTGTINKLMGAGPIATQTNTSTIDYLDNGGTISYMVNSGTITELQHTTTGSGNLSVAANGETATTKIVQSGKWTNRVVRRFYTSKCVRNDWRPGFYTYGIYTHSSSKIINGSESSRWPGYYEIFSFSASGISAIFTAAGVKVGNFPMPYATIRQLIWYDATSYVRNTDSKAGVGSCNLYIALNGSTYYILKDSSADYGGGSCGNLDSKIMLKQAVLSDPGNTMIAPEYKLVIQWTAEHTTEGSISLTNCSGGTGAAVSDSYQYITNTVRTANTYTQGAQPEYCINRVDIPQSSTIYKKLTQIDYLDIIATNSSGGYSAKLYYSPITGERTAY